MKGIHCALQGRLGQDVELRESGKNWCRLSLGVGEGDEVTWVSVAVFEEKARALVGIITECVDWHGRDTAHRALRNGVAGDAAGPDRRAEAQGTILR